MQKNVIKKTTLISGQSIGAAFQTSNITLQWMDRIEIQINVTTANGVGTFTVQNSVDGVNWVDMQMDAMPVASANKTILIDIQATGASTLRVNYNYTSGTGTTSIYYTAKES